MAMKNTLRVSARYRLTWGLKDCSVINLTRRLRKETTVSLQLVNHRRHVWAIIKTVERRLKFYFEINNGSGKRRSVLKPRTVEDSYKQRPLVYFSCMRMDRVYTCV